MITPRYSCSLWSKDLIAIEKDQKKRNSESSLISVKSLRNHTFSAGAEKEHHQVVRTIPTRPKTVNQLFLAARLSFLSAKKTSRT
jgi:hypothetical protein